MLRVGADYESHRAGESLAAPFLNRLPAGWALRRGEPPICTDFRIADWLPGRGRQRLAEVPFSTRWPRSACHWKVERANRLSSSSDGFLLRSSGGTRGGGRTHNLRLRRPTLYPIELLAQNANKQ